MIKFNVVKIKTVAGVVWFRVEIAATKRVVNSFATQKEADAAIVEFEKILNANPYA